jgi:nicotinate-nucleotide adenylyltransferase
MPTEQAPLGILGGTFDPIHYAHLRLAQEAVDALSLARVRFIPAGQPTHRAAPQAAGMHRLAMVQAALAGLPQFECDAAEVSSSAPSFTVPTLERLRGELGLTRPLVLIMGADAFLGLASWHRWRELFALAHIALATRPGHVLAEHALPAELAAELAGRQCLPAALAQRPAGGIARFEMTALDISATAVREQIRTGRSPRFLVPEPVLDYIEAHSLYR